MDGKQSEPRPLRDVIEGLTRMDLRQIAMVAFVIGVLLHACVFYAVLDDGEPEAAVPQQAPAIQQRPPTPTRPPDRTSCAEIRGTDYRSEAERAWFRANCSGGSVF